MFYRYYENKIVDLLKPGKVLIIYGPRRAGKTTLINTFLSTYNKPYYLGFGEDSHLQSILESQSIHKITTYFRDYDLVVIDEAQKIQKIGLCLKILVDHLPHVSVLASGSSSFDLSNKLGEPLTGRQKIITLYPLALLELKTDMSRIELDQRIEDFLIYGCYPETLTITHPNEAKDYLITLKDSYLYKDILELENLKDSRKLSDLLKLIAFQIGKEVSLNELSNALGIAKQTVDRYLGMLEKAFVIKRVAGFSRNLRKEISKTSRYYFYDNGVRNAIINNFNDLSTRNDTGQLWENFLFIERMKKHAYYNIYSNYYFWRTYDKKEIDLIEERDGKLYGYEFKLSEKKVKPPALWLETYENSTFTVINKENYFEFIT